MIKKILLFFGLLFFLSTKDSFASIEFKTDVSVTYKVQDNGTSSVIHKITLTNLFSNFYATAYTLKLNNVNIKNAKASDSSGKIDLNVDKQGETTSLKASFPDAMVGKDKSRTFEIAFEEEGIATHTGGVWEVSIPRLGSEEEFNGYSVTLSIPDSFGKEAYLSPKPKETFSDKGNRIYLFDKDPIQKTGVVAAFGEFQVFDFTLIYHLENPVTTDKRVKVSIPPDTAFQKMYYRGITPTPENVEIDSDGNWLATFILKPRERRDITATGSVQVYASPRSFLKPSEETLRSNLGESNYWQSKDPEIVKLAQKLRTPKAIYDFVSQNLKYDTKRVKPNVERLGAKKALDNPTSAICMEYTDLFVALSRAAGIPAREVNGFAYTENPEIKPISLVADVLHAWPEYWDSGKSSWVPVDPTWASTTGGVDYFTKLDLRHFTFVNHGKDPTDPYPPGSYKLGANPQKDVFVSFGTLPAKTGSQIDVKANTMPGFPFSNNKIKIRVENKGQSALYNLNQVVLFDGKESSRKKIESLPPFSNYESEIESPFSLLAANLPETVQVLVGDRKVTIGTERNKILIYDLTVLFLIFIAIVAVVFIRLKKHAQTVTYKKSL